MLKKLLIKSYFLASIITFPANGSESDNLEVIGSITSDLFKESVLPYLPINDSTPQNLVSSIKQLMSYRRISKVWKNVILNDIVNLIKERKLDANVKDAYGTTALHLAAKEGNLNLVKILIAAGAKTDIVASYNGHDFEEDFFIKRFPFLKDVDIKKKISIDIATKMGCTDISIINLCIPRWYAINDAIYNGHDEVTKLLQDCYADLIKDNAYLCVGYIYATYECNESRNTNVHVIPFFKLLDKLSISDKKIFDFELRRLAIDIIIS